LNQAEDGVTRKFGAVEVLFSSRGVLVGSLPAIARA
jgi:hypothetical protein